MNKLDFTIKPGWPASTETWEYLQNMILNAQNIGLLGGQHYVLSGCLEAGGNVGDGVMVVGGEVVPFVGGPVQPKIIIVDTTVNRQFFGGVSNAYYHNRVAVFGTGPGEVLYSDFKRNDPANGVLARLDRMEQMLKPLMGYDVAGTVTYGSWLFWGRPASEIPTGWEAVPDADWKGRVPVVLDDADVRFNTVGQVGGEAEHTLTVAEMAAHSHVYSKTVNGGSFGDNSSGYGNYTNTNTTSVGGDAAHNNLQPYKVVLFIRFIG